MQSEIATLPEEKSARNKILGTVLEFKGVLIVLAVCALLIH